MLGSRLPLVAGLILLLIHPATALSAEEDKERLPILEAGIAALELDDRQGRIDFAITPAGPLVALQPLVGQMGGELEIGPLGESHALTLNESTWVFGLDSRAITLGEEIMELSQAPAPGLGHLLVPIDLLDAIYGSSLGYQFSWRRQPDTLVVRLKPSRELRVTCDLVHLQGVTTVVFQFPTRPRYRLRRSERVVEIDMVGDRLSPDLPRSVPRDELVRQVRFRSDRILLQLASGAVAQDYTLEDPFRLVFDVFRQAPARTASALPVRPPRDAPGIRTIVVDPGHGGTDTGATGESGLTEKNLTLTLARTLKRMLEARLPVKVVLTRDEDADLPLETRAALANQQKADLFISLHLNSSVEPGAHGAETYFSSLEASDERAARAAAAENLAGGDGDGDPLYDLQLILWDLAQSHHMAESQRFASLIQEELNIALELRNRGVKQAPFRVLMGAAMPAVLVELGFLTNHEEEAKLQDPAYRAKLAETLVRAVSRYRAKVEGLPLPADEEAF